MDWPSDRVAHGGIFHPAKVKYSPETKKFIQELIQESKLTMMQRQKINYSLRNGDPLPPLQTPKSETKMKQPEIIIRPGSNRRRQYSTIVNSGAYERDSFVPLQRGVDREYAKKHLQDFMAFGKEIKEQPKPRKKLEEKEPKMNRFDELKQQIQEREEWLAEMENLGQGFKYKSIIEQQIAARYREMEKLKTGPKTEISQ